MDFVGWTMRLGFWDWTLAGLVIALTADCCAPVEVMPVKEGQLGDLIRRAQELRVALSWVDMLQSG